MKDSKLPEETNVEENCTSETVALGDTRTTAAAGGTITDLQSEEYITVKSESLVKTGEDFSDQKTKKSRKGIFWLISIVNSTGQGFFGNFFSQFATRAGASGSLLGFLTSIRNLLGSLFQGVVGRLSDRFGRKYILLSGFILSFIITIPIIFFTSPAVLIVVAVIQALSVSITIPTWNAALGDVTETEGRAAFIGKISAIGSVVSVSLTLLVAIIFYLADEVFNGWIIWGWEVNIPWRIQYGISFTLSAISFLICVIAVLAMKETRTIKKEENGETGEAVIPNILVAFKDKAFIKLLIAYSFFGLVMSAVWPINPIIQVDILDMSFSSIAVLSATFIIAMSLSQIIGGRVGDKIGRKPLIVAGGFVLVFYPIAMIPAILTNFWPFLILANTIAGLVAGSFFVALNACTLDLASEDMMGAYSGLKEMFFGLATFLGSLSAGFISDALKDAYGIVTMAIAMAIGISILRFFAAFGFLFIKESLPKEVRAARQLNKDKNKL